MTRLISGSALRKGKSGEFLNLSGAQPQLPESETTATGFSVATDALLRTSYRSSLGFIEFRTATMWSALPAGSIKIQSTGSTFLSTSTYSGTLVVDGGVGISGNMIIGEDIVVNDLIIGKGYEGINNIVFRGTASTLVSGFEDGQNSIAIGYDVLTGLITSNKSIAIGRKALSSGTNISNTIAIGDSSLTLMGTNNNPFLATITNVVLSTLKNITTITNAIPPVVTVATHGYNSGDQVYIQSVSGIATATSATSVLNNTGFWVNVINANQFSLYTDKALTKPANSFTATVNGSVVTLTSYVNSGTVIDPVKVTITQSISSGTRVVIKNVLGTTQLNGNSYYVDSLNTTTIALFNNSVLEVPVNGTSFTAYSSSGTVNLYVANDDNLAIGISSAPKLVNGSNNFFFGNNIATNLTTGSNNTIIGHNQFNNLTNVSGIIALGADNLIDGRDNQINIGSVFYYDGRGNTDINSDTRTGLGTDSTSTNSGALVVVGGLGVSGSVYSGGGGHPDENYELYVPKITVTTGTAPSNPRIGDIWIDTSTFGYLQYIRDGSSNLWIQLVQL